MSDERFNKICDLIEHNARYAYKTYSEIVEEIAQEMGMSERELKGYFRYVSGTSLISYIKERKMMAAYEYILDSEEYDADGCVGLSGLADQPTFNKRFKKTFGLTPVEAFQSKDRNLLKVKISWENTQQPRNISNNNDIIFGLTKAKYSEIKELVLLQEKLGFEESQSVTAYRLYEFSKMSLKEAFGFVDAFYRADQEWEALFCEMEGVCTLLNPSVSVREKFLDKRIKSDAEDPEFRYVYFHGDIDSVITIYNVIDELHEAGEEDVTQVDIDVINICAYEEIDVKYCKKAVAYFKANATEKYGKDAFREYIEYILCNVPIETAFENIEHLEGWDDYSVYTVLDIEKEREYDEFDAVYTDYREYEDIDDYD